MTTDRCEQELCPNWSGDGDVCPCAIFDLDRNCTRKGCGKPLSEHEFGAFCP